MRPKIPGLRANPRRRPDTEAVPTGTSTPTARRTDPSPCADTSPRPAEASSSIGSACHGCGVPRARTRTQAAQHGQSASEVRELTVRATEMRPTYSSSRWIFMLRKSPCHVQRAQPNTFTGFRESEAKVLFCARSSRSSSWASAACSKGSRSQKTSGCTPSVEWAIVEC